MTNTKHTPEQEAFYKAKAEGKTGKDLKPFRQAMSYKSAKNHREVAPVLTALETELLEACNVIAKAELYDPASGIIDAEVLEAIQQLARAAIKKATQG